jgi:hypothetical protein
MLLQVAEDVTGVLPEVAEHFVVAFVGSLVHNTGRRVANKLLIDGVDSCRLHNHVFKNHDE